MECAPAPLWLTPRPRRRLMSAPKRSAVSWFLVPPEQTIDPHEGVSPVFQTRDEVVEPEIEFVLPVGMCADVHKQDEPVEAVRVGSLASEDALENVRGAPVIRQVRGRVVGV